MSNTPVRPTADGASTPAAPSETDDRRRSRWVMLVAGVAILAAIGGPVVGLGVFHGADMVLDYAPWAYEAPAGYEPNNPPVGDTVNAAMPMRAEIRQRLLAGELPLWSRAPASGVPLLAVPDLSPLSPILLPYYLLPLWYAPAASKVLEFAVAVLFTALFARRLRLSRVAAITAGLVYGFSGFQVVWTNWPQTTVGAFIPMLFWAVERAIAERTLRSGLPIAAAVALLVVGGFPAVTGFALLAAGVYSLIRVLASHREPLAPRALTLGVLAGMVLLGLALTAVQLFPFLDHLAQLDMGHRVEGPHRHLPLAALATMVFPMVFGPASYGPYWGPSNIVEINTFVGVVAVSLIAVAAAHRRPMMPIGARGALWGLSGASVLLIFVGGAPLGLMQTVLPFLFGTNAVGRMRSVLGLILAVLAAAGLDALLHRGGGALRRREILFAVALGIGALLLGGLALTTALDSPVVTDRIPRAADLGHLVWPGLLGLVAALLLAAWLLGTWQRRAWALGAVACLVIGALAVLSLGIQGEYVTTVARVAIVPVTVTAGLLVTLWRYVVTGDRRLLSVAIPVLVAIEAVGFAHPYWARSEVEHFYPVTETHRFLLENLDGARVALADRTLQPGTTTLYGIPALTAHMFYSPRWRDLIAEVDPRAFGKPTFPKLHVPQDDLDMVPTHPILDRLSTRYFAVSPTLPVFGERHDPPTPDGAVFLTPNRPLVGTVPTGSLRGVRLAIVEPGYVGPTAQAAWLHVDVLDDSGAVVRTAARRVETERRTNHFTVPLPQVDREGDTQVRLRLAAPPGATFALGLEGEDLALGYVAPVDDGVRPVWVRGAVVYEQEGWLPRVRWASAQEVIPDAAARLARLASDDLPDDTVVLEERGPEPAGRPAVISVLEDTGDRIVIDVDAEGAGYVVVADGLQFGWRADLDGVPTELRVADHALGAVGVPEGEHRVTLRFAPRSMAIGGWTTLGALLVLVGLIVATRRRRAAPSQLGNV